MSEMQLQVGALEMKAVSYVRHGENKGIGHI